MLADSTMHADIVPQSKPNVRMSQQGCLLDIFTKKLLTWKNRDHDPSKIFNPCDVCVCIFSKDFPKLNSKGTFNKYVTLGGGVF